MDYGFKVQLALDTGQTLDGMSRILRGQTIQAHFASPQKFWIFWKPTLSPTLTWRRIQNNGYLEWGGTKQDGRIGVEGSLQLYVLAFILRLSY